MMIDSLLKPKPSESYSNLTKGGNYNIHLNQEEACVALKIHDYGVDTLTGEEKTVLHSLIGKLKDQIWP